MRFLRIVIAPSLLVTLLGAMPLDASAELLEKTPHATIAAAPLPSSTTPKGRRKWLTKKHIAIGLGVSCAVATAIAVPIACSVHHRNVIRRDNRRRNLLESITGNQQIVASRQEQAIENLLNRGPMLSPTQRDILQSDLAQVRTAEAELNAAFTDLVTHGSVKTAIMLENNAARELRDTDFHISNGYTSPTVSLTDPNARLWISP
jgi:hypothetical protein